LVDDDERAFLDLHRERRTKRAPLDLLGDRVVVAARLRTEDGAAVAPQRRPRRSDLRTAGALLRVRLLAGAADERTVLGHVRAAALGRVLAHDGLPDHVGLDRAGKHRVVEVDRPDGLVARVDDVEFHGDLPGIYFLPFFGVSIC